MRAYDKCIHFIHIKGENDMERRKQWLGYFCVILSAMIFGCMPLGANFLYAQGVTPMTLVFLRNLLCAPDPRAAVPEAGRAAHQPRCAA